MCIYLCELCVHVYIAWQGVCVCVSVCVCVCMCVCVCVFVIDKMTFESSISLANRFRMYM